MDDLEFSDISPILSPALVVKDWWAGVAKIAQFMWFLTSGAFKTYESA